MKQTTLIALLIATFAFSAPAQTWPASLTTSGYDQAAWVIVVDWDERTGNGQLVHGYHLRSLSDGSTDDVYLDATGSRLPNTDLDRLEIAKKHWDISPITTTPEIVPGFPAAKKTPKTASWLSPSDRKPFETVFAAPADTGETKADTDAAEKGLTRYGAIMELPAALTVRGDDAAFGEWHVLSDGSHVWTATVRVLGAVGLRLHFAEFGLPSGAELIAYPPDTPETAESAMVTASGWGPSAFNEAVTLECQFPAGVAHESLTLSVDRIGWMYRMPFEKTATVGACNIRIACQPDWLTVAMAVGRLAKADSDGLWACTGALVADTVTDSQIPYFLTANHCVSSQSEAASIEVYWLYQASACDATAPSMSSVPRTTGGADYLAGSSNAYGTDFAFLRLNNAPPDGLTYCGYSTDAAAVDSEVTAIHHPQGLEKRISFGKITDSGSPKNGTRLKPIERFHEVKWHDGTTEPGSSGCPLFLKDSPVIIGQLYGGYASCGATAEPDYFGRMDVTYPIIQKWLSPSTSTEGEDSGGSDGCQWSKATNPANAAVMAALVGLLLLTGLPGRNPRI